MSTSQGADFTDNLGKVYGIYTGGFIGFVLLLAVLEQVGVPNQIIAYLFVFFTIAIYAGIGILSRTMQVSEYYVAGRKVPAVYNGMATAADWMSGASFVGLAGTFYVLGYDGLAFALGWTGGYVLVAVLIAPYLRKFGAYTVPDFMAARYGGNLARLMGIIVLFCCSFTYVVAQIYSSGIIASRFLGMNFEVAVFVGLAGILVCSLLGGMRAVTWTQVAQYIVLIIAYLIPAIWMSASVTGIPVPQLTYGLALEQITQLEQQFVAQGLADAATLKEHITPGETYDRFNFYALIFCLMVGTAALPHVLMRYFTTPSVRDARRSVGWSLLFILALYITAPAYAAFAKLEVFTNVVGLPVSELANQAAWIFNWGAIEGQNLVRLCGEAARDIATAVAACGGADHIVRLNDLNLARDMIVLATPEMAGMPFVISGMVAAGGLAAALSTADGLLLAIANALSHDIYYKMVDRNAPTGRRLIVARTLLIIVAVLAAYTASTKPSDILSMVAWAFSLAAAGLFPALALGVWWKRCNSYGAIAGVIAGFGVTLYYLIGNVYGFDLTKGTGDEIVWGFFGLTDNVASISAGVFGVPVGFLVMIVVSYLTPAPSEEMQQMIDDIRRPSGDIVLKDQAV
jgi:cation/acetate symporter